MRRQLTPEHRQRLSDLHHARLNIPIGCNIVYGVPVPEHWHEVIRTLANKYRRRHTIEQTAAFTHRVLIALLRADREASGAT